MQLMILFGIGIALAGVVFALQNNVPVTVTFIVWRFDSSLAMVLLLALATGAIIVALVSTPPTLRARWALSRLRKECASLRAEQDALRTRLSQMQSASGVATARRDAPAQDSGIGGTRS